MYNRKYIIPLVIFPLLFAIVARAQNDTTLFGEKGFIEHGLLGKIYFLPVNTRKLPNFDTLQPVDTVYAQMLNVPPRAWKAGFPGLPDRFEWFALEYTGSFKARKPGLYTFTLLSDDGSKLFIDDSLVINNDGLHGTAIKKADVDLDNSTHAIKVQYFQGPRYAIALQLYAGLQKEKEAIFPGDNFTLYTHPPPDRPYWMFALAGVAVLLLIFAIFRRRKREPRNRP